MPTSTWTLTARWVFPADAPPLERGVITIKDDRIVAVDPPGGRSADLDLGNAAILPGLVNAHTHLDLSGLRGKCPPTPDFTEWLRGVIRHRRGQTSEQVQEDIRAGLAECLKYGTTLLGDIAAGGASWDILAHAPLRAVVFYELLGLPKERAEMAGLAASAWLNTHSATTTCRPALSPHAPYSVRASLFAESHRLRRTFHVPLSIHLAETAEELELLRHRRGPFVQFLEELGVCDLEGLMHSPEEVLHLFHDDDVPALFVHCNYLETTATIPNHGTIIYCPRTHAAFNDIRGLTPPARHAPRATRHPPRATRHALRGVRVALGTDSLASNPDLDLLAEARFIHQRYPDFPGDALLRMATLSGAEALGWADETGSLTPGKSADLVVLPLPNEDDDDPHRLIFGAALPVERVLFRGQWTV